MKKKLLSMIVLVCLLVTAMPTMFAAADGDVTKTFTAIFHHATDTEKEPLAGVETCIELCDDYEVQPLTEYSTEGKSSCEITYNGDAFIYEFEEEVEGQEEPIIHREAYSYIRVVLNRAPGYSPYSDTVIYTVDEFVEMTENSSEATVYFSLDEYDEEFVYSDELTYEIYREYYNGEYGNTSIYYGNEGGFNSEELIEAFSHLKDIDNCINVYANVWGNGFPRVSEELMLILDEYSAWFSIYNEDTREEIYWDQVDCDRALELNRVSNPTVTDALEAANIPYVLLTTNGFNGKENFEAFLKPGYGVLKDGPYDETEECNVGLKYVYAYDLMTDTFKLCPLQVLYGSLAFEEAPEESFGTLYLTGDAFPTPGYYVIVDEKLPDSLTTQPGNPGGEDDEVEVQKVDVKWSETTPWKLEIENITPTDEIWDYYVYIYKDGEEIDWNYTWANKGDEVSFDFSELVAYAGEGEYVVEVDVQKWTGVDDIHVQVGEGVSNSHKYVKPAKQLGIPANLKYDSETGAITFDKVDGAVAYDVWFWFERAGIEQFSYHEGHLETNNSDGWDFKWIAEYAEELKALNKDSDMRMGIRVCAVSENIDEVAYGEFAEYVVFENKLTKEQVKENFDKAFENVEEEPTEAVSVLVGISNDTIVEMLKSDTEFAGKVEKLDSIFIEDLGERYKGATSKTDAVDASKVKVVGVALNGIGADSVELTFAAPEKEATVPEGYKNGVQLDISLLINGDAREDLRVPVTITMPIPTGVDTKDLVILHYHGDATEPVVIVPTVNADGTMTFIVDGFSTFVVANQVVEATAPKTGDTSATVAICSLLLLAAGVVLMKRNTFAK